MKLKTHSGIAFLTGLLLGIKAYAETTTVNSYHFDIYKQIYPLSTFFSIQADDTYHGLVKSSRLCARTNYELSDKNGWQATGIKRLLSLGCIYPWATELDIYNTQWQAIGMIDGQVVTTAAARFSIYDEFGTLVGIAYLDQSLNHYNIVYPDREMFPIVELTRQFEDLGQDSWSVIVHDPDQIDERILRIFAAMACDLQEAIDNYYAKSIVK